MLLGLKSTMGEMELHVIVSDHEIPQV